MALLPTTRRERNELTRFHNDIDDLFNSFLNGFDAPLLGRRAWPAIDVADRENEVVVRAEVPGCKSDDIDISIHNDVLTISGEKKETKEHKDKGFFHVESAYGAFRRDVRLPSDVDSEKVEAVCENGVLTITLPKAEKAKPIKVQVKG
ncbi:MAG TPA: Hsp20/alpha crystallin family protein [Phycisphaerales bacterium]|nr:Hsp20/alpha crystallin family protein [Phycisphaerales bacterium]